MNALTMTIPKIDRNGTRIDGQWEVSVSDVGMLHRVSVDGTGHDEAVELFLSDNYRVSLLRFLRLADDTRDLLGWKGSASDGSE